MKVLIEFEVPEGLACFGFCNERQRQCNQKGFCNQYNKYDPDAEYDCTLFRVNLLNQDKSGNTLKCDECKDLKEAKDKT